MLLLLSLLYFLLLLRLLLTKLQLRNDKCPSNLATRASPATVVVLVDLLPIKLCPFVIATPVIIFVHVFYDSINIRGLVRSGKLRCNIKFGFRTSLTNLHDVT